MFEPLAIKAFGFGIFSAASLPLGALVAFYWVPRQRLVAALMAFGGGALLAALTIDLVAETVHRGDFYPLAAGCVLGGLLFDALNQAVNSRGGFLRKAATTISHLKKSRIQHYKMLFKKISRVRLFHHLPSEELHALLPYISSRTYRRGTTIIRQGDPGDSLFIIEQGRIDIIDEKNNAKRIAALHENDVLGVMALVTGEPRSATAVAAEDTRVWLILKQHFDRLLKTSPLLSAAVKELVTGRITDLQSKKSIGTTEADRWLTNAEKHIDAKHFIPTEVEIKEAASLHSGAPLAIWFGILLDGIPESLVIGASMLQQSISLSLIAGLFLSNFPEALSSSAVMRRQDYSFGKIFTMWTSLMVITGIGAYFGSMFFAEAPRYLFAVVNGMAAGAMLTMISETMLPEAFYKGGAITGFSTLLGFLAAIFFKTLE